MHISDALNIFLVIILGALAYICVNSERVRFFADRIFSKQYGGISFLLSIIILMVAVQDVIKIDNIRGCLLMLMIYGFPIAIASMMYEQMISDKIRALSIIFLGFYFYIPIDFGWQKSWLINDARLYYALAALCAIIFISVASCGLAGDGNKFITSHLRLWREGAITKYDWRVLFKTYAILFFALVPGAYCLDFIKVDDILKSQFFEPKLLPLIPLISILIFIAPAFLEELVFRGCLQGGLSKLFSNTPSWCFVLISAFVFGLFHLNNSSEGFGWPNWRYAILATIAGIGYGLVYDKTKNLALATLLHTMVDVTWLVFFKK